MSLHNSKILEALGVEDLGIYNVVGSLIIMFDFVSSGLSNATQRYLNLGLGHNNIEKTRQYFSQSLVIHIKRDCAALSQRSTIFPLYRGSSFVENCINHCKYITNL